MIYQSSSVDKVVIMVVDMFCNIVFFHTVISLTYLHPHYDIYQHLLIKLITQNTIEK